MLKKFKNKLQLVKDRKKNIKENSEILNDKFGVNINIKKLRQKSKSKKEVFALDLSEVIIIHRRHFLSCNLLLIIISR